jgi:hypothetical protein
MCPKHYQRLRTHGSPHIVEKRGRKAIDVAQRMPRFIERRDPQECWPWRGARNRNGYGVIHAGGRSVLAHRLAYMLAFGMSEIPNDLKVLHTCDHPWCVNPGHAWLGSQAQNMADMKAKGRARNGYTGKRTQ